LKVTEAIHTKISWLALACLLLAGPAFTQEPLLPGIALATATAGLPAVMEFQLAHGPAGVAELADLHLPEGEANTNRLALDLGLRNLLVDLTPADGVTHVTFDTLHAVASPGSSGAAVPAGGIYVGPSEAHWLPAGPAGPLRNPEVVTLVSAPVPYLAVLENTAAEPLRLTGFHYAPAAVATGRVLTAELQGDASSLLLQLGAAHGEQVFRAGQAGPAGPGERLALASRAAPVAPFEPPPGVRWLELGAETLEVAPGQKVVLALAVESFRIDIRDLHVQLQPFISYETADGRSWQQQLTAGLTGAAHTR
jgi:hypothetical protein